MGMPIGTLGEGRTPLGDPGYAGTLGEGYVHHRVGYVYYGAIGTLGEGRTVCL